MSNVAPRTADKRILHYLFPNNTIAGKLLTPLMTATQRVHQDERTPRLAASSSSSRQCTALVAAEAAMAAVVAAAATAAARITRCLLIKTPICGAATQGFKALLNLPLKRTGR